MIDFCRGRHSWSKLLRLLEWMPWDSAFQRAMANDPDYAFPSSPQDDGPPSILAWDRTREQSALIYDALEALRVAVLAPHMPKGRTPKARRFPRPVTAAAVAERRQAREQHKSLSAQMLPHLASVE